MGDIFFNPPLGVFLFASQRQKLQLFPVSAGALCCLVIACTIASHICKQSLRGSKQQRELLLGASLGTPQLYSHCCVLCVFWVFALLLALSWEEVCLLMD